MQKKLRCLLYRAFDLGSVPSARRTAPKKAFTRCVNLADDMSCKISGSPDRPAVCASLKPNREMCGKNREEALAYLEQLERIPRRNHTLAASGRKRAAQRLFRRIPVYMRRQSLHP
ncbi:MAG: hypothetical protein V8T87_04930 [Victivallales bacterium]